MKTGLIIEGGVLRSAFAAGVLKTWAENDIHFDEVVAVGEGALVGAYYHAGQVDALENMYGAYFEEVGEISRFFNALGEDGLDGGELVRTALSAHPLDMDAFTNAKGTFSIATTRSDNGDQVVWPLNIYDREKTVKTFLEASVIMPGKGEPVALVERSYFSGAVRDSLPVQFLRAKGCDRIVVLSTHLKDYERKRVRLSVMETMAVRKWPMLKNVWQLSHLYDHEERTALLDMEVKHQAVMVAPVVESTSFKRYGVSRSAAAEFYAEGLRLGEESVARVKRLLQEV